MTRVASASRRWGRALAAVIVAASFLTLVPIVANTPGIAQAQVAVSAEFRTALQPYGRWERHSRWGEVWIPASRGKDWRPYTVGRWVYTEDWGWYWVEDREEADWGWVTFHYGRWIEDYNLGWAWLPGEEWGPGFVQWRHGGEHVGWAPMGPDELIVEYRDRPDVWCFVRARDFVAAPRLALVLLPRRDSAVFVRNTIVVNQTVVLRDRGRFAVNPGIPATVIAASVGRPIRAYDVRPRVLAGTARIPGAIEVRAQDVRNRNFRAETNVRESRTEIRATGDRTPQLRPLGANEHGRLGDNPPRAARGGPTPPTTGQAPATPQQQRQGRDLQKDQQGQQPPAQTQGRGKQEQPAQTQGRGKQEQPAQTQGRSKQEQPAQTQGRGKQEQPAQTQGRGKQEPPAQTQGRGKQEQPAQTQGRGKQESAPSPGRGAAEQRQQRAPQAQPQQRPATEGRGAVEPKRQAAPPPRPEQSTQGRGGGGAAERARPQAPAARSQPERQSAPAPSAPQRSQPSATEGRGGGGGAGRAAPKQGGQPGGAEGRGGPGPR